DGKVVVVTASWLDGGYHGLAWRLNGDGTLDSSFADGGVFVFADSQLDSFNAVVALPDGSIVIAGSTFVPGWNAQLIIKLDGAGHPDPTFGSSGDGIVVGRSGEANSIILARDGAIVVA